MLFKVGTQIRKPNFKSKIHACTCVCVYLYTHTYAHMLTQVLHMCAHTPIVFGEYLTPTTHSQVLLISVRDSEIHLLTGLYLDTHQLTMHRTAVTC